MNTDIFPLIGVAPTCVIGYLHTLPVLSSMEFLDYNLNIIFFYASFKSICRLFGISFTSRELEHFKIYNLAFRLPFLFRLLSYT